MPCYICHENSENIDLCFAKDDDGLTWIDQWPVLEQWSRQCKSTRRTESPMKTNSSLSLYIMWRQNHTLMPLKSCILLQGLWKTKYGGIMVRATSLLNSDFNSSSGTLWDPPTITKLCHFLLWQFMFGWYDVKKSICRNIRHFNSHHIALSRPPWMVVTVLETNQVEPSGFFEWKPCWIREHLTEKNRFLSGIAWNLLTLFHHVTVPYILTPTLCYLILFDHF